MRSTTKETPATPRMPMTAQTSATAENCSDQIGNNRINSDTDSNISRGVSNYRDVSSSRARNFSIPDVFLFI